jgi:two-component system NtrC family sensor kinase
LDKNPPQKALDIQLLKRKIEREKKARQLAEQQLEVYSREIYQTNLSLKKSLDYAKKKNAEIEYLTKASCDVSSELTLFDILQSTVALTGRFFNAAHGINAIFDGQKVQRNSKPLIWSSGGFWDQNIELQSFFFKHFPLERAGASPEWLIMPIDENDKIEGQSFRWIVCINFELGNDSSVWIGFLSKSELIDEEALNVLEIAKGHLQSGIRRRLSDARTVRRNIEFQETATHLEDARKQLIQSEKMASLGELAAGVAHEINNPIGFIRANLQVLDDYLKEFKNTFKFIEEKVNLTGSLSEQEFTDIANKQDLNFLLEDADSILKSNQEGVERVKEIVESLKSFSHAGDNNLKQISIYECVDTALRVVANEFKYQHQIINELEKTLPNILSNYGQLQQVFVNLLINSAHSMPDGGTLKIYSELSGQHLLIHVEDTGVGMDEQTKNQIFNPFFTTKPVGKGTGLGLSVTYAILEAQHISIVVDSTLGKGTCFTLGFTVD